MKTAAADYDRTAAERNPQEWNKLLTQIRLILKAGTPLEDALKRFQLSENDKKALRQMFKGKAAADPEQKALSELKLDLRRAKDAASDLWSTTKPSTPERTEREKVYQQISKLESQVSRWKPTRS